ncbi:peptidylprolyl isomerase [Sphingomonas ginkgonis]|uniref:Peptidylprolyl isomerase n=1 Tax=Sphingomonas ginkgonis TaxID=2315330 RepID=A0A429V6J2_9SPHN|nr:peptidylprolyl isomerase [Sphingomonas ginkgonis]RST29553.1 peptidylprolyl isomerase [Sphingomonas ginkgonis]
MRLFFAASALGLLAAAPAPAPSKDQTPTDIVNAAPVAAWRAIPADDLMLIDFEGGGQAIVQLAPDFAPVHVANIRAFARGGYWTGATVYRVQDNYVTQWGTNDDKKGFPAGVVAKPPREYERPVRGLAPVSLPYPDSYAARVGYWHGWPLAWDPRRGMANLTHCYGMVGVGRDLYPDTGAAGELYTVIGQATRQLDRNIALAGRVVEGMTLLSALPRGTEALGMYKEGTVARRIVRVRLASELPTHERPSFEYLDERSPSFAAYVAKRANRKDAFYEVPIGGVDLCNAPVPVRRTPAQAAR